MLLTTIEGPRVAIDKKQIVKVEGPCMRQFLGLDLGGLFRAPATVTYEPLDERITERAVVYITDESWRNLVREIGAAPL
ncbi:MAG: hypothetical protein JWO54_635 [Candidatus Saccharibacteria bacterium]|nr:hypothetical protein [Candidatus Saccharibacteria bacterium]MDB5180875.1 hypothetical protein [Candidatus Saccharibacteria bacterium]